MKLLTTLATILLLLSAPRQALAADPIFESGDHCVAYRTVKDMWFFVDTPIVGKSCELTVSLTEAEDGRASRISVVTPIASLDSGNGFRDDVVADLLGVEAEPDLRFVSSPLDVESLRAGLIRGSLVLPGVLSFGGREFPVELPFGLTPRGGRHFAAGVFATTFDAVGIEVPTVAAGLIARPHDVLELAFQIELERVEGLVDWAADRGLSLDAEE